MAASLINRLRAFLFLFFGVAPFGFGAARATSAGDLRMLGMAVGALLGALAARLIERRRREPLGRWQSAVLATLLATLPAGALGHLYGATALAGIWGVAAALGGCYGASRLVRPDLPGSR
jgi:hypothetical protein